MTSSFFQKNEQQLTDVTVKANSSSFQQTNYSVVKQTAQMQWKQTKSTK